MVPKLPSVVKLIDEIRKLYAVDPDENELWRQIQETMRPVLQDPELLEHSHQWPETVFGAPRVRNLLFYVDPDYGFAFNATVRKPKLVTSVHDHGDVWTLYGLIEGHETMYRYKRVDDGDRNSGPAVLEVVGRARLGPGDVDAVAPGMIHQEHAGDTTSTAFIIRGRKPGTFPQRLYDLESGAVEVMNGPELVPYQL